MTSKAPPLLPFSLNPLDLNLSDYAVKLIDPVGATAQPGTPLPKRTGRPSATQREHATGRQLVPPLGPAGHTTIIARSGLMYAS